MRKILEQKSSICLSLRLKEDQSLSWFLAAYVPWADLGNKGYNASREGIKATNTMSRVLDEAIKVRGAIVMAVALVYEGKCMSLAYSWSPFPALFPRCVIAFTR